MAKATKSTSGFYSVQLARAWRDPAFPDFLFKPGTEIRVDEPTLARMQAEPDLVTHAIPVT